MFLNLAHWQEYHVENGKIGYYQKESHQFVEIDHCLLLHPKINQLLTELKGARFLNSVENMMIRTFQDGLETQIVFYPQENLDHEEIIHRIKDYVDSIYVDHTCIYGNDEILEKIGDRNYLVRPESFFQVNTKTTKKLYDQVKEKLEPSEKDVVLDLYCGAGTIGLYIAPYVKHVYGVEIVFSLLFFADVQGRIYHFFAQKPNLYRIVARFVCGEIDSFLEGVERVVLVVVLDCKGSRFVVPCQSGRGLDI